MGEGKVGKRVGRERGGCGGAGNGNAQKSPKTQQIWHLGRPLGATAPCHAFLESSFQGQHFHRR